MWQPTSLPPRLTWRFSQKATASCPKQATQMLFDHLSGIKAATGHSWSPQQLSGPLLIPTSLWDWFPYSSHPPDWQKHAWRHKEWQAVQTDQPAAALEVQWGKKKNNQRKQKLLNWILFEWIYMCLVAPVVSPPQEASSWSSDGAHPCIRQLEVASVSLSL